MKISSSIIPELTKLNSMLLSAEKFQAHEILAEVTSSAKEFLKADLVDLYIYSQVDESFILPPTLSGARMEEKVIKDNVQEDDVVFGIVKNRLPLYVIDVLKEKSLVMPFTKERENLPINRFVVRENIQSSAAIPLICKNEVVGVIFINYRYRQNFDQEQRELIELFSSLAALVILNSGLLSHKPRTQSENFIFISYAREDFDRVYPIYKYIIEKGYNVWLDNKKLLPGQDWDYEIQEAIKRSKVFIACLSNNSVSKKGYFQKELKKGLDIYDEYPEGQIFIIPLLLESCNVPSKFQRIQWCDINQVDGMEKLILSIEDSFSKTKSG